HNVATCVLLRNRVLKARATQPGSARPGVGFLLARLHRRQSCRQARRPAPLTRETSACQDSLFLPSRWLQRTVRTELVSQLHKPGWTNQRSGATLLEYLGNPRRRIPKMWGLI